EAVPAVGGAGKAAVPLFEVQEAERRELSPGRAGGEGESDQGGERSAAARLGSRHGVLPWVVPVIRRAEGPPRPVGGSTPSSRKGAPVRQGEAEAGATQRPPRPIATSGNQDCSGLEPSIAGTREGSGRNDRAVARRVRRYAARRTGL